MVDTRSPQCQGQAVIDQSTPRPALSLSAAIEETSRSSLLSTGALAVIYMRCVCKCTRTRQLNWHYTALRTRHQECRRKGLLLSASTVVEPNHIYYAIHSIAEIRLISQLNLSLAVIRSSLPVFIGRGVTVPDSAHLKASKL